MSSWAKFTETKWMVSIGTHSEDEIKAMTQEIETIKHLTKCDSNIYCKFNQKSQQKIQSTITNALFWEQIYGDSNNPTILSNHLIIDGIYFQYFGLEFHSTLLIWKHLRRGELRLWNRKNIGVTVSPLRVYMVSSKKGFIIDDTKELITKTCTPNAKLLGKGYCRKHENENNCNIPWYLIEIIVRYFNITLDHLHKLLRK